jgi:uncharacterized protein yeeC
MEYFDKLAELFEGPDSDLFKPAPKKHAITKDERLVSSFEQINDFVRKNSRTPNEQSDDISEAMLGHMLNAIKIDKKKIEALNDYDEFGLLETEKAPQSLEELFAEDSDLFKNSDNIFNVGKLPNNGQKRVVENGWTPAERVRCPDFESTYEKLFKNEQNLLLKKQRTFSKFTTISQLKPENFYVYEGQMCYVANFGEIERKAGGYSQQRMLVIFENGTMSKMFRRSLAQRLYEPSGFVVVDNIQHFEENKNNAVGYIYVLRSKSDNTVIQDIKDLYKIGMTEDTVEKRIANAENDPTYLMAPVEIIEKYKITGNYNTQKVESIIHRFFADARMELSITDKSGREYSPSEWYVVPIEAIREAIDLLNTGDIVNFIYDTHSQKIVEIE